MVHLSKKRTDELVSWGLIGILFLAPVLRGSWDLWAQTFIQCATIALFALWAAFKLVERGSTAFLSPLLLALGGMAFLGWISFRQSAYPFGARNGLWNLWTELSLFFLVL